MISIIKFFKNYYYLVWSDAIYYYNSEKWKYDWKFYSLLHTTLALSLFLMFLSVFVVYNGFFEQLLNVGNKIEVGIVGFLVYGLLPLSLNYFLIFKDKKYEKIILDYNHSDGKLVNKVLYSLLLIPLIFLLIGFILVIFGLVEKEVF